MITVKAPCPICNKAVKVESFHGKFAVGCMGDKHSVQVHSYVNPEEAARAWDRLFLVSEVPVQ